jgi:hypothetical protein
VHWRPFDLVDGQPAYYDPDSSLAQQLVIQVHVRLGPDARLVLELCHRSPKLHDRLVRGLATLLVTRFELPELSFEVDSTLIEAGGT